MDEGVFFVDAPRLAELRLCRESDDFLEYVGAMIVGTGSDVLIAGLVVSGTTERRLLIRAAGGTGGEVDDAEFRIGERAIDSERSERGAVGARGKIDETAGGKSQNSFRRVREGQCRCRRRRLLVQCRDPERAWRRERRLCCRW
jgi:hypothetical protein